MSLNSRKSYFVGLPAFWVVAMIANSILAQGFRVESEVFRGDSTKPISENLTLFSDGIVYDFLLSDPREIVIQDSKSGKFTLLDPVRKVKTTVVQMQVEEAVEVQRQSRALQNRSPFLFEEFVRTSDANSAWMEFQNSALTYRIKGSPVKNGSNLSSYVEFINNYAKLSSLDPKKMPPLARLKLNLEISKAKIIPDEVQLTFRPQNNQEIKIRSRHYVIWQISRTDQQKIKNTNELIRQCKEVPLTEYQNPIVVAEKPSASFGR